MNGYAGSLKWWGSVLNLLAVDSRQCPAGAVRPEPSPGSPVNGADGDIRISSNPVPRKPVLETLAGQPVGRKLKIAGFVLAPDIYQRLLEMGLTKGTECTILRYAPMGDPIEVKVRGYSLSLRLAEAAGVQVSCH